MGVESTREVIPRSYEHRIGGSPTASRLFVATVDEPTPMQQVFDAIGISLGNKHPDHGNLICDGVSAEETDRYHVSVTYSYGVDETGSSDNGGDGAVAPWLAPDTWSFSTTNASVACTEHYPFDGQNVAHPLVNTAGDVIAGLTKAEAELKIQINAARLTFDLGRVQEYVNAINDKDWCGFPKHTVQCIGVSATPDRLEFQGAVVDYWRITVELVYRASTHNLFLPNVGWNVIVNGKKQRAWVFITEDGRTEKVPAPHPVALNMAGGFLCGQDQAGAKDPDGGTDLADDNYQYQG